VSVTTATVSRGYGEIAHPGRRRRPTLARIDDVGLGSSVTAIECRIPNRAWNVAARISGRGRRVQRSRPRHVSEVVSLRTKMQRIRLSSSGKHLAPTDSNTGVRRLAVTDAYERLTSI
jgi:hypothetical protein